MKELIESSNEKSLGAFKLDRSLLAKDFSSSRLIINQRVRGYLTDLYIKKLDDLPSYRNLSPTQKLALKNDFHNNPNGLSAVIKKDLVGAWKIANDSGLKFLKKDTEYLVTLAKYTDNTLSRKFPSMGVHEEALIRYYTGSAHEPLNLALKSGGNLSAEIIEFRNVLNVALDKLPNHQNVVFRGLDELSSISAEFWTVGQKIQRPAFVSSSTSENVAETFMNLRGGNVTLRIESKTGKLIQEAAINPNELEVLFKSGKEFEVLQSATPKPNNPSILQVVVKEL